MQFRIERHTAPQIMVKSGSSVSLLVFMHNSVHETERHTAHTHACLEIFIQLPVPLCDRYFQYVNSPGGDAALIGPVPDDHDINGCRIAQSLPNPDPPTACLFRSDPATMHETNGFKIAVANRFCAGDDVHVEDLPRSARDGPVQGQKTAPRGSGRRPGSTRLCGQTLDGDRRGATDPIRTGRTA